MHEFTPSPECTSEWWRTSEVWPNVDVGDIYGIHDITSDTWILRAFFNDEPFPPPLGYPMLFPTITDVLLYFRWIVLPIEWGAYEGIAEEIPLDGVQLETAKIIDSAPPGSSSLSVLDKVLEHIDLKIFYVVNYESIHTFISNSVSIEEMRLIFDDPAVDCVDDQWKLSPKQWQVFANVWDEDRNSSELGRYGEILWATFLINRNVTPIDWAATYVNVPIEQLAQAVNAGELNGIKMQPEWFADFRTPPEPELDWMIIRDEKYEAYKAGNSS